MWNSDGEEITEAHGGQKKQTMLYSKIVFPKYTLIRRKLTPHLNPKKEAK